MTKRAPVKCVYCGKYIYRDDEFDYSPVGTRYAHDSCIRRVTIEADGRNAIHEKVKDICGTEYSRSRVEKQIDQLLDNGRTLDGILKTLDYWFDVKHGDPSKANGGIGIVDFVYGEAMGYYEDQERKRNRNNGVPRSAYDEMSRFTSIKRNFNSPIGRRTKNAKSRFILE